MVAATLLGVAVAVALMRSGSGARVRALSPPPAAGSPAGSDSRLSPVVLRGAFVVAGVAAAWFVGGLFGLGTGAAVAWWGPRLVARLDDTEDETAALTAQLPLALDLLSACLAGGSGLREAICAVASAVPEPCSRRLSTVAAALAVGSPPDEAFRALGEGTDAAGKAARALSRAAEGGAPVAGAVHEAAEQARRTAAAAGLRRARRAGVLAVGPLSACFLPAFVVMGVVPTIVGLARPILQGL